MSTATRAKSLKRLLKLLKYLVDNKITMANLDYTKISSSFECVPKTIKRDIAILCELGLIAKPKNNLKRFIIKYNMQKRGQKIMKERLNHIKPDTSFMDDIYKEVDKIIR